MNVIAEMAGADSLAAIITYLKQNPKDTIIPTLVISPNEDDFNIQTVYNNYDTFIKYLRSQNYKILNLILIPQNKTLWNELTNLEFISPCIACHLYCHLVRLPLARQHNGSLLTGERFKHNDNIKINQNNIVLKYFSDLLKDYKYIRPIENIYNTEEINNILKDIPFDILNKDNFIKCNINKIKINEEDLNKLELAKYLNKLKRIAKLYIRPQK